MDLVKRMKASNVVCLYVAELVILFFLEYVMQPNEPASSYYQTYWGPPWGGVGEGGTHNTPIWFIFSLLLMTWHDMCLRWWKMSEKGNTHDTFVFLVFSNRIYNLYFVKSGVYAGDVTCQFGQFFLHQFYCRISLCRGNATEFFSHGAHINFVCDDYVNARVEGKHIFSSSRFISGRIIKHPN